MKKRNFSKLALFGVLMGASCLGNVQASDLNSSGQVLLAGGSCAAAKGGSSCKAVNFSCSNVSARPGNIAQNDSPKASCSAARFSCSNVSVRTGNVAQNEPNGSSMMNGSSTNGSMNGSSMNNSPMNGSSMMGDQASQQQRQLQMQQQQQQMQQNQMQQPNQSQTTTIPDNSVFSYPSPSKASKVIADMTDEQPTHTVGTASDQKSTTKTTTTTTTDKTSGTSKSNGKDDDACGAPSTYKPKTNGSGSMSSKVFADNSTDSKVMNHKVLTEDELLSKLDSQGKALYNSLDPEGKALALKLASQAGSSGYVNKNMAVKAAAQQVAAKKSSSATLPSTMQQKPLPSNSIPSNSIPSGSTPSKY